MDYVKIDPTKPLECPKCKAECTWEQPMVDGDLKITVTCDNPDCGYQFEPDFYEAEAVTEE
jgi:predicted nucleic-acid-binding Zn-ribbon protein